MPKIISKELANEILNKYNNKNNETIENKKENEMNNIIDMLNKYKDNQNGGNIQYNFHDSILELKQAFREHYF